MKKPLQLPCWPSDVCPHWVIHRSLYLRGLAKLYPVLRWKVWEKKQDRERTNQHRCLLAHSTVKVRPSQLKCEVRSLRTTMRASAKGSTLKDRAHCVMAPGHWDFYERNQQHHTRQTKHAVICVDYREHLGKKTSVAVRTGESKQAPHLLRVWKEARSPK